MIRGAIDIGNTFTKAGLFSASGELIQLNHFQQLQEAVLWLKTNNARKVMISDVRGQNLITDSETEITYINPSLKLPFKNLYTTPATLGADRIAVLSAAAVLFPGQASLIFDIGTCMTIDVLTNENEFNGGNISPGINMRLKAMHQLTGKLPLSNVENSDFGLGHNTLSALANGAVNGLLYEIEGYISLIKTRYPDVNILFCGGDAHYFEKQLKYKIFANPNLVLLGLYHLSVFND